jgi:CHAT domain-containing protein
MVAADLLARSVAFCRDVADRFCEAASLSQLAAAEVALGRRASAREHLDTALVIAREHHDPVEEASALVGRARLAGDAGRLPAALDDVQAALRIIESQRANVLSPELRTSFLASTRGAYETAIDLLMRQHADAPSGGYAGRALAVSERARSRSLLDSLSAARFAPAQLLELPDIQASLEPSDALLEFALGDQRSYLWVITASSLRAYRLAGRGVIEAAAIRAHEAVQQSHRPGLRTQARRALSDVGQLLFADAARELTADRLIVVADGALQFVPFAAVSIRADGEPLLVRHEIVTLPSASAVATLRSPLPDRRTPDRTLALLADPVFQIKDARAPHSGAGAPHRTTPRDLVRSVADTAATLERLEYTGEEARRIASLVSPSQALVALGLDATRDQALSRELGRYRFVHFASHALVNTRRPHLSGIVLSTIGRDGAVQDGFLRLADIYAMQLAADVVVLSACQTALGRDVRGEGLVGLTRGFLHAGARSVVSTLWEVRDRQTAELMARFYEGMLREGLTPGAALRRAQLITMREPASAAPFYWAAFGVHGDWR